MNRNTPSSPEDLYQKALRGEALNRDESNELQQSMGLWIEPTALEPEDCSSEPPSAGVQRGMVDTRNATDHVLDALYGGRCDVVDLVTGDYVVNIRHIQIPDEVANEIIRRVDSIRSIPEHEIADISEVVDVTHTQFFPGFKEIFSEDEAGRFASADHQLRQHVCNAFYRMALGGKVEDIIRHVNYAMETQVEPYVSAIANQDMRNSVQNSVALWKRNMLSPYRNIYFRSNRSAQDRPYIQREYGLPMLAREEFSVALMDGHNSIDSAHAGYEPNCRMVFLREPMYEGCDFMHVLDALHELTHACQHQRFVSSARTDDERARLHQEYLSWMDEVESDQLQLMTAHGILEEECEAFAAAIELLFARIGFGQHRFDEVAASVGIAPNDYVSMGKLQQLIRLAMLYFPGGGRKGNVYPPAYVKELRDLYIRAGVLLHRYGPDGRLIRAI